MRENEIFTKALSLGSGWEVYDVQFNIDEKAIKIFARTIKGRLFTCGTCGEPNCPVFDHGKEREWRHMNFFQYQAYIVARPPRVSCPTCNKPKTAANDWARERSGFSLYFEAFMVLLAKSMPMNEVARMLGEHDKTLWPILHHYVDEARNEQTWEDVHRVAVDETSQKKGHNYVSLFLDLDKRKVLHVSDGKDQLTLRDFKDHLLQKGGHTDEISELCMDRSPSFIAGARVYFPNAEITYDKFHVMKILNTAVDETRRKEQRTVKELKNSRYVWLKNEENLNTKQKETLIKLKDEDLKTAKAYQLKLSFGKLWESTNSEDAKKHLDEWYYWATHSQIPEMVKAAKAIRNHEEGILRWFTSKVTNGILEAINGLIQSAKRRARGYRSLKNLKTMIYLIAGGLELNTVKI